jgi:hypothetical protein
MRARARACAPTGAAGAAASALKPAARGPNGLNETVTSIEFRRQVGMHSYHDFRRNRIKRSRRDRRFILLL